MSTVRNQSSDAFIKHFIDQEMMTTGEIGKGFTMDGRKKHDFFQYVEKYCGEVDLGDAWEHGVEGVEWLQTILQGHHFSGEVPLVNLGWAMTILSIANGRPMVSGMYNIEDPEGFLFNALCNDQRGYLRISSHYPDQVKEKGHNHKGIDWTLNMRMPLPAHKTTLLFGRIQKRSNIFFTFLKFELYGTNRKRDLIRHGFDYMCGGGVVLVCKEKVPRKEMKEWKKLIKTMKCMFPLLQIGSTPQGITDMLSVNEALLHYIKDKELSLDQQNFVKEFSEKIDSLVSANRQDTVVHLLFRNWQEVIVLQSDLYRFDPKWSKPEPLDG